MCLVKQSTETLILSNIAQMQIIFWSFTETRSSDWGCIDLLFADNMGMRIRLVVKREWPRLYIKEKNPGYI